MSKSDAMFWGAIVGVIPALWVGAYLFHLAPIQLARGQWWGFPWYVTVIFITAFTSWSCSICAGYIQTKMEKGSSDENT